MRRFCLFLSLILALSMFTGSVLAEGAEQPTTEEAQPVEAPVPTTEEPEYVLPDVLIGTAYGDWDQTGKVVGEYSLLGLSGFTVIPGNGIKVYEQTYAYEETDGKMSIIIPEGVEAPEGMTVTAELTTMTQELAEKFSSEPYKYHFDAVGSDCIIVTATAIDKSNPLAEVKVTAEELFVRNYRQWSFLEDTLYGRVWNAGGENVLTFDADGNIDLNGGAATGTASASYSDELPLYLYFSWEDGATVYYIPTAIDETSISFVNRDIPDQTLTLTLVGDAAPVEPVEEEIPAGEAPAEEEAAEGETEETLD